MGNCLTTTTHGTDFAASASRLNAFTVDVEDYYHVSAFARHVCPRQWDSFESRVVHNTRTILRLLERQQVRGTFFILGWVASRFPDLVREIQRAGHEIACHSYWHRLVYDLDPDEFRADLRQARDVLEQITGTPVTAYRAPSFSITARSLWALEILAEEGFRYDSSIFPIYHDRYGVPGAQRFPYCVAGRDRALWEFPPSVCRLAGMNLPVSGGGYFRLYPLRLTLHMLRTINHRDRQPFMFYVHPWELDPQQPRIQSNWSARFRHYVNLGSTERKLHQLLSRFRFGALSEALQN